MAKRLLFVLLAYFMLSTTLAFITLTDTIEKGTDLVKAGIYKGIALFKKIPDIIPTPMDIFRRKIEKIAGLPFTIILNLIDYICSVALSVNGIKSRTTPDLNSLNVRLITESENISVSLNEMPDRLWDNPLFDKSFNTVVIITGWTTNLNGGFDFIKLDVMYRAYKARGNYNFLVVDPAQFISTLYTWSAFNAEHIGKHLGNALIKLTSRYPRENIHLVGHSLGAQIAGVAGRYYYTETNELLPRITGLDPANPCFNEGQKFTGLYRGDAEFVDVIHTNNGVFGNKLSIGDVDFFPNGETVLQPGCFTIVCAHIRAWLYYAESVYPGNENNFLAVRCDSLASLSANLCPGRPIPMGYNVPIKARGNYFLVTRAFSPYGMNH